MEDNNEKSGFIREVVKGKNKKKSFFIKLIAAVIIAGAAAFTAAFVFAFSLPLAKSAAGIEDTSESKISIQKDENTSSDEEQKTASSSAQSESETGEASEKITSEKSETEDSSETGSGSETKQNSDSEEASDAKTENGQTDAEVSAQVFGVEEYQELYKELEEISEPAEKSIVKVTGITSQTDYFNQAYENEQKTSGVIIGKNEKYLFILTDYSILENVERIQVELNSGDFVDAVYQSHDEDTGMAVVKVAREDIPDESEDEIAVATLGNSYNVYRGEPVIALGSPMGYYDYMSYGTITSVSNIVSVYDDQYPVFTTSISGSTGGNGVIVNLDGEVIGIIIPGTSGLSEHTINAYSVSQMKSMFEQLSNNEPRPFIGLMGADVTPEIAERTGIPKGMIVTDVKEDSPAMLAGLTENDVIVKLADMEVDSTAGYAALLKDHSAGEKIKLVAMRKGAEGYAEVEFDIVLGEK